MARKWKKLLAVTLALSMTMSLLNMTVWAGAATDAANETLVAAQTALEEAKADLETKKAAQTEAQAAVDAVQAAYDEALSAIGTTDLDSAKGALDTAKGEAEEKLAAVENAEVAVTAAQEALDAVNVDPEATDEEKQEAQDALKEANAALTEAQAASEKAQAALETAQSAANEAQAAYDAEVAEAGESTGYTTAKDALTVADEAVEAAEAVVTDKEAAVEAAKANVEAAKDVDAAAEVTALIGALTEGSASDDIRAARAAYEALTSAQKKLISSETLEKLQAADASLYTIHTGMTQEEVDDAIAGVEEITVQPGHYGKEKSHIKINLTSGNQTVTLSGDYTRLMIVTLSDGNVLNADEAYINGELSVVHNQSPALYIPYGSLEVCGNLVIDDHDYGIILGYTNAGEDETSSLTIDENANVTIVNCDRAKSGSYDGGVVCGGTDYFSYVDTQGDGTRGSAITTKGKGSVMFSVEENAVLDCHDNFSAGIFAITVRYTFDAAPGSQILMNSNNQGLNMNTDYVGSCTITLDNATLETCNNSSNGITGQALPYLLNITNDSVVKSDHNGAIGINNFYINIEDSDISVSNNRSHGATNVSFTSVNSKGHFDDNAYIGLNITKLNDGETYTRIENSAISARDNGGPGIRFYTAGKETHISDSRVYTDGNGEGASIYGYKVKPSDSGYWAGIVGKDKVTLTNSFVHSVSAGGYALYNDSTSPAELKISGTDVVALDKTLSPADIFDDWNSKGNTGRTYVTGGSLQANAQDMTKGFIQSMNQQIPAVGSNTDRTTVQYAAPVNTNGTALTRFDLNKEFDHGTSLTEENDIYKFTTIDPNRTENAAYDYTFRYNTKGEDLVEDEKDNAYVWTPVTVITYDATEGTIADAALGTAQKGNVVLNSRGDGQDTIGNTPVVTTVTNTDPETGAETSEEFSDYIDATDYTICGSSMALSEAVFPAASRSGYSFSGWYYAKGAENIEKAAQLAATGKFTELYALLKSDKGAELTSDTLTAADGDDVEAITVYALWDKNSEGGGGHTDYYKVTVNYYDKETGKKIATSYVSGSLRENSRYDVTDKDAISIEGYTYDSTTGDPLKGTMDKDKVIDVWYVANEEIPDPEVPTDPGQEIPPVDPGKPTDPGQELPDPEVPTTDVPKTGDSSLLWLAAAAVSGIGLAWLAIADKKRKNF